MTTQTKCTISLCCLFIVEIFPLPFTALISLYVVRKRPKWFPGVVERLYADKTLEQDIDPIRDADPLKTKRKCTFTLVCMIIVDLILPVTIPTALYIIRKRPRWFKNVSAKLYADLQPIQDSADPVYPAHINTHLGTLDKRPEVAAAQLKKHLELERKNLNYAHSTAERTLLKPAPERPSA